MSSFKTVIKQRTIDWLLEESNPSVRYFTLRDILGKPESHRDVKRAKRNIMESQIVTRILSMQNPEGYWGTPDKFYTSKYRGTVWQLIILAELGVDGRDERIRKACEFILDHSQEPVSGGFSIKTGRAGGAAYGVIPCLTGNMLWSLIRFNYLTDPRVQRGIEWVTAWQRFDDAVENPPAGGPYDRWEICWGAHTCHMGVVKVLKAFSEIPHVKRTGKIERVIKKGAEFMLIHHIHKRSHNLKRVSKPGWLKFGFPLMYQSDVLEILGILTRLGCRDDRMQESIDLVVSKQGSNGRWKLENTYNDRFHVKIEQKGKASKWITLNALKTLKQLGNM